MNKDIGNYIYDISFRTEVYDGIYWVPVNTLGKTRYTNDEISAISNLPPKEKKSLIGNLYEAVQLFQLSNFKGVLDNRNFYINGVHWQTHKAPEEAVTSNEGCCAADTNWLSFLLSDKYDHMGSFCYGNTDGNGHITTFIRQGQDTYYFIDMMMCRTDSQAYFCREGSSLSEWNTSEWAGFLYECKDPVKMCHFYIDRLKSKERDVPYCFYLRDKSCVSATGCKTENGSTTYFAPKCDGPRLIYLNHKAGHNFSVVELPECLSAERKF